MAWIITKLPKRAALEAKQDEREPLSVEQIQARARARVRATILAMPESGLVIPPSRCPDFLRKAA